VLSLLFKTEGQANEKEDIIVLIRAQIVDTAEISDMQDNA
jgi:type II secretory pathway component GspD/PulD (secretin)